MTADPLEFRTWRAAVALLIVHLAALLSYDYFDRVERPNTEKRMAVHQQILTGEAPYQRRYRILAPATAEVLSRVLQRLPPFRGDRSTPGHAYGHRAFSAAYLLLDFAALILRSISGCCWSSDTGGRFGTG